MACGHDSKLIDVSVHLCSDSTLHPERALWFNICLTLWRKKKSLCLVSFHFYSKSWCGFPWSCLSCFLFLFFLAALHLAIIEFPPAYGELVQSLQQQPPPWLFDCMETRFCSRVAEAANDWRGRQRKTERSNSQLWRKRTKMKNKLEVFFSH